MASREEYMDFQTAYNLIIDGKAQTHPDYIGKDVHGPYQVWAIKYVLPNDDVREGYTCGPEFANTLINILKWKHDPEWDTLSWDNEEKFKLWKQYFILNLPETIRDLQGRINETNTWWVNYKSKNKSTFLDKVGKDPLSTTQLGLYAAYVVELSRRSKNNITIGQLLNEKQVEAHEASLQTALSAISLPDDQKLTIEAINNFKPRKELEEKWEMLRKPKDKDGQGT